MASRKRISQRAIWFQIHLWLGLTLGMIGIAVGLSGSVLVIDHEIDEWLHPARYRISGSQVALPFAEYAARAGEALEGRAKPTGIRLPDGEEGPIMVFARPPGSTGFLRVYLDAPTGRVLDVTEGVDFIGWNTAVNQANESLVWRCEIYYWFSIGCELLQQHPKHRSKHGLAPAKVRRAAHE